MIRAMGTAASGMKAQQMNIDTIANNLANVNTTGYKKSHTEFQDLLYEKVMPGGQVDAEGRALPNRIEIGHGVKLVATNKNFSQGTVVSTNNPLDLMVEGDGFFQLRRCNFVVRLGTPHGAVIFIGLNNLGNSTGKLYCLRISYPVWCT